LLSAFVMFKKICFGICLLVFGAGLVWADEITLKGNYYGYNLYVINPSVGEGFCVTAVMVNDKPSMDEISSNAFEIDFSLMKLNIGDPVTVVIKHKSNCKPEIVNPRALLPSENAAVISPKVDKSGTKITWSMKGDLLDEPIIIEQFRWNKWIKIGELSSADSAKNNIYSFDIIPHTGINQFRIVFNDANENPVYSKNIKFTSRNPEIILESTKVADKLMFSADTQYEIFDLKGNFISEGFGKEAEVTDLEKGKYWLNYDNKSVSFTKK